MIFTEQLLAVVSMFENYFLVGMIFLVLTKYLNLKNIITCMFIAIIQALLVYYFLSYESLGYLTSVIAILILNRYKREKSGTYFLIASIYIFFLENILGILFLLIRKIFDLPEISVIVCLILCTSILGLITVFQLNKYNVDFNQIHYVSEFEKKILEVIAFGIMFSMTFLNIVCDVLGLSQRVFSLLSVVHLLIFVLVGWIIYMKALAYKNKIILQEQKDQERVFKKHLKEIYDYYEDVVAFRHDYKNMLLTLGRKIESTKNTELIEYFQEITDYSNRNLNSGISAIMLSKIQNIESPRIQSILFSKISQAKKLGININLSVYGKVKFFQIQELVITRIISNILDNAIESAAQQKNKGVEIALMTYEKNTEIIIKNLLDNVDDVNIDNWMKKDVSSKGENRGNGLNIVKNLIEKNPMIRLQYGIEDNAINFQIRIEGK